MEEYDLKLNPDYYIAAANNLIKGRQSMTPRESTLLFIAQAQVVAEDTDFKTYITTVSELATFMGIDPQSLHRDLKDICKSLMQRVVEVQIGGENARGKKKWKLLHWINSAEYDNGKLTIRLSDDIKPYMLALAEQGYYSQSKLGILCSYRSYYTRRLYQIVVCDIGSTRSQKKEWTFTVDELRDFFQIKPKEYPRAYDLLKYTVKPAIEELNSSPYAYIWDYQEHHATGRGRPLQGVSFKAVIFKDQDEKDWFLNRAKPTIDAYNAPIP